MKSVLFVCLGNICRSAMAHGILQDQLEKRHRSDINVDSAGTSNWHIGNPPDSRAIETAASHGTDISGQRARQVTTADFENFDLIVAMDVENYADLQALAPQAGPNQLVKCLDFGTNPGSGDVPDPYYGGGFNNVMEMLQDACSGIADHVTSTSK